MLAARQPVGGEDPLLEFHQGVEIAPPGGADVDPRQSLGGRGGTASATNGRKP